MTIPAEITAAVLAVRKRVRSIKTDEYNKHDGYSYVSIDTYYEKVATIATEENLVWRGRMTECMLVPDQGKNKDRLFLRITMAYDMMCGTSCVDHYAQFTFLLPHSGAQTTGIAASYGDKVFMRTAFCVPSGEGDADAEPQQDRSSRQMSAPDPMLDEPMVTKTSSTQEDKPYVLPPRVRPGSEPAADDDGVIPTVANEVATSYVDGMPCFDKGKVNEKSIAIIVEVFKTFMPMCKSISKLKQWHADNAGVLDMVQSIDKGAHQNIRDMFRARFDQLSK